VKYAAKMNFRVLFIGFMCTFLIVGATLVLPFAAWLEDKIKERYPSYPELPRR
jgi:hypothetical protein